MRSPAAGFFKQSAFHYSRFLAAGILAGLTLSLTVSSSSGGKFIGGGCDGCRLMFEGMPGTLGPETKFPRKGEEGEPLEIDGVIYQRDGKAPAADVILYLYHTDTRGLYAPAAEQKAGLRHGRFRGWVRTDETGRYRFRTIRPAPYPGGTTPAHIHPTIKEPGKNEYYIDEYRFEDDPLLTASERAKEEKRGGSGIISLEKNEAGIWMGRRDIVLGQNIPNYY
ncbi:MAG: intradiol ring-cleavage dioxygenase [Chthoniobacterales bacterium]